MNMKLSDFVDIYFEDKQNELKQRTIKNKRYMMEQHIIPYFGNQKINEILDEIGYNRLSIYDFIKHMSDKRGAHIDVGHSLVVGLVNSKDAIGLTPIHYFAIQMIYAAKKQIPELAGYWAEMPELIIEDD